MTDSKDAPVLEVDSVLKADPIVEADPVSLSEAAVVPVKRKAPRKPSKPDAVLAAAVEKAREGLLEVVPRAQLGEHISVAPDADRLVTHRFAARLPGYEGWHWYATLSRVPRGKDASVCEVGLLPSADSLLSPEWVPWANRVLPEDADDTLDATPETNGGK